MTDDELSKRREEFQAALRSVGTNAEGERIGRIAVAIIDEALSRGRELATLKTEVTDRLQFAMKSAITGTPERDLIEARAALAKAEQERDEARAVARQVSGNHDVDLSEAIANARAVAFEEAKRFFNDAPKSRYFFPEQVAQQLQALASSPPSGQWVAADVMEEVTEALRLAAVSLPHIDNRSADTVVGACVAALSALESEASR